MMMTGTEEETEGRESNTQLQLRLAAGPIPRVEQKEMKEKGR